MQRNSAGNVQKPLSLQPSDVNLSASDQKALSLPSFTVTQTLVNLLAERAGMKVYCNGMAKISHPDELNVKMVMLISISYHLNSFFVVVKLPIVFNLHEAL